MTVLGSVESRTGRLRLGAHPAPDALLFGADGARTSYADQTSAVPPPWPGAPDPPCQPISGWWRNDLWVYLYDGTYVGTLAGPTALASRKVVGGSITQDIRATPYAQGRVELVIESRSERQTIYQSMVGVNLLQITQQIQTWWGISGAVLGRFEIQSAEASYDAHTGDEMVAFDLISRASGTVGPTVEGDLTGEAFSYADSLGLVADGRASIEGIAAYILSQYQGRQVTRGPGITPTVAYQASVTHPDTSETYYLGPYNISPPQGAAQVLARALYQSGIYVVGTPSGGAVLTGIPQETSGADYAPPAWFFGDDECAWPVRSIKPNPRETPAQVVAVNQSMLAEGSTQVVNTQFGVGTGKPYYFNNFRAAGEDGGAFARRARQLAYLHDQAARSVTLTVPSHPAMRAGDICAIDLPEYGNPLLANALWLMTRVTHPLGPDMNATIVAERL